VSDDQSKLEQWKFYADSTLNVSNRRIKNNRFYLRLLIALSGAVIAAAKLQYIKGAGILFGGFIGLSFSLLWFFHILSYKQLNSGKYSVLTSMAEDLPFSPFSSEWSELENGEDWTEYITHTSVESWWPRILALPFSIMIAYGSLEVLGLLNYLYPATTLIIAAWLIYVISVLTGNSPLGRWLEE
jgi:hypothetical protein